MADRFHITSPRKLDSFQSRRQLRHPPPPTWRLDPLHIPPTSVTEARSQTPQRRLQGKLLAQTHVFHDFKSRRSKGPITRRSLIWSQSGFSFVLTKYFTALFVMKCSNEVEILKNAINGNCKSILPLSVLGCHSTCFHGNLSSISIAEIYFI